MNVRRRKNEVWAERATIMYFALVFFFVAVAVAECNTH